MRKLMIICMMVALMLVPVVPAMAHSFYVGNAGDYASQCVSGFQFANSGNFENDAVFLQYNSSSDDFAPEGISFSFYPYSDTDCNYAVDQDAVAVSY